MAEYRCMPKIDRCYAPVVIACNASVYNKIRGDFLTKNDQKIVASNSSSDVTSFPPLRIQPSSKINAKCQKCDGEMVKQTNNFKRHQASASQEWRNFPPKKMTAGCGGNAPTLQHDVLYVQAVF